MRVRHSASALLCALSLARSSVYARSASPEEAALRSISSSTDRISCACCAFSASISCRRRCCASICACRALARSACSDISTRRRAMLSALFCRFVRTTAAALSHSAAALSASEICSRVRSDSRSFSRIFCAMFSDAA